MPSFSFTVITQGDGAFIARDNFNPPGPFGFNVELRAKLLKPEATAVSGTLAIYPETGQPNQQKREFRATADMEISLGSWRINGGNNLILFRGRTEPVRPNTELHIVLSATLEL